MDTTKFLVTSSTETLEVLLDDLHHELAKRYQENENLKDNHVELKDRNCDDDEIE